jgi:hypothetical protein
LKTKTPWEFHDDLSRDRLQLVAKILRETRNSALPKFDVAAGDGAWSLGCTIYERSANMITVAAGDGLLPWLKIIEPPLRFIFSIGDVPVRFYRGDAEAAPGHHLNLAPSEQLQLGLAFNDAKVDLRWRFVVETNVANEADRILLVGRTKDREIKCFYEVPPLEGNVVFFTTPRAGGKPPQTQLPPTGVRSRKPPNEHKEDDDGKQPV